MRRGVAEALRCPRVGERNLQTMELKRVTRDKYSHHRYYRVIAEKLLLIFVQHSSTQSCASRPTQEKLSPCPTKPQQHPATDSAQLQQPVPHKDLHPCVRVVGFAPVSSLHRFVCLSRGLCGVVGSRCSLLDAEKRSDAQA